MNLKILTLFTLLTSTQLVYAENHLILIGGGGEPEGESTIFDNAIFELGKNLKNLKWNYEVLYNGGHKKSELIIKELYSKSKPPAKSFVPENYTKMIKSYKLKIEKNEIKSGDQLMILIGTHGAIRGVGELSHKISATGGAVTDLNNLAGSATVNLDDLQELIALTNKKGIKLGIVDFSCHSGATLALKKNAPNTCIVTGTGPDHFSYAGPGAFGDTFVSGLKPGLSLEEAFLKARSASIDVGYPMISTNENDNVVKEVYKNITPYLYFNHPEYDKLASYILANNSESKRCEREDEFKNLISQIEKIQTTVNSKFKLQNAEKLTSLISNYKIIQDELILISNKFNSPPYNNIESLQPPASSKITKLTWKEILDAQTEEIIDQLENSIEAGLSKEEEGSTKFLINFLKLVDTKKKEILKSNPQFVEEYNNQTSLSKSLTNMSLRSVQDISEQEKVFYDEFYRLNQKPNSTNPCKSIKF